MLDSLRNMHFMSVGFRGMRIFVFSLWIGRQVQTDGEGANVPVPGVGSFFSFVCFLYFSVDFMFSSRGSLSATRKKMWKKWRRPAMKEWVRTLKINLNGGSPLLKCFCCDLPLSPLFRSVQFIIYSVLPPTSLVLPFVVLITLHCIYNLSLDNYSALQYCTHTRRHTHSGVPGQSQPRRSSALQTAPLPSLQTTRVQTTLYGFSCRIITGEGMSLFLMADCAPLGRAHVWFGAWREAEKPKL